MSTTVTPPSDFIVLKNFCTETHSSKSHAELAVKQLSGFYFDRNVACKITRIELSGSPRLRIVTGLLRAKSKPKISPKGNAANDSLTQGMMERERERQRQKQRAVKVFKTTKRLCCS